MTTNYRINHLVDDEELWSAPTRLHLSLSQSSPFGSVQELALSSLFVPAFTPEKFQQCFGDFVQHVRTLRLDRPVSCAPSLVNFVASFPRLEVTAISTPIWISMESMARRKRAPISPDDHAPRANQLRGALYLEGFTGDSGPFLLYLAARKSYFEKVVFDRCVFGDTHPVQAFVSRVGVSLKSFHVMMSGDRKSPLVLMYLSAHALRQMSTSSQISPWVIVAF